MGKEILVNVANRETRIAVIDDNQLVELRIEREEQVVGNIYKGRVENVLPGMDAAFVDVGLERNAFLYVADILPEYVDSDEDEESVNDDVVAESAKSAAILNAPPPAAAASLPQPEILSGTSAPDPKEGGAQRSGSPSQRNRNRRGGRSRRDEPTAENVTPASMSAPEAPSRPSALNDYRQYLSDPDRNSDDAEGAHSHAFFDEIGTEDGFDLVDIIEQDSGEIEESVPSASSSEFVSPMADLDEDGEMEPGALALAREAEEIFEEATTRIEQSDDDYSAPPTILEPPTEQTAAIVKKSFSDSNNDSDDSEEYIALDHDATMIDAASAASEPDADSEQSGDAALSETQSGIVRVPRSRPGGRRAGPVAEGGDGTNSKPINQAKRPMRRGGAPGGGARPGGGRGFSRRHASIADLVQTKQELLLQVVKGPRGTKGSRVSTRMSLPGRYLVLMPDANNLGVSRKIEESKERDRLKNVVERFRQPGYGIIVRTEAEGRSANDLFQDYSMLVETWQTVWAKAKTTPAPSLIHQDQSLIYTIMRDVFGSDIDRLIIDSADDYARACEIIDRISPDLTDRIHLYDGEKPLFEAFRVEQDIDRLLRRKVWLKSGGYLVIDQTEALTSIDVNTGKFVGSSGSGLSETILQTNMEATGEIARQLRLRDLGGMIVLDFIDMDNQRDKKLVMDTLFKALKHDRSRTKIASISPLGLIEMTRKRTKETVDIALTDTCPYCHGIGRVPSAETVSMQVEREIAKIAAEVTSEAIVVTAHPDVIAQLVGEQGQSIDMLERQVRRAIYARADSDYHVEKYEVEPGSASKIEQVYPLPRRGQIVECSVQKSVLSALPWASAFIEGGYQIEIGNGARAVGQVAKIRLLGVARSYAVGEVMGSIGVANNNNGGAGAQSNNNPNGGGRPSGQGQGQGRQNAPERSGQPDRDRSGRRGN